MSGSRDAAMFATSVTTPAALVQRMRELEALGYDCPPPEGWAVWRVHPSEYDPAADAHGGKLFECGPSPAMVTVDASCDCWSVLLQKRSA